MCKNLPIINLPNEGDDLVLETYASNEHWSAVLKIKGGKLCKYYNRSSYKAECNYPAMEKEILTIIGGVEKFLIFLAPKSFLIRTDYKRIVGIVKKNFLNMQVQRRLLRWQLWLNQFSFSIKHIQGLKNSMTYSLTRALVNDDHQS